MTNTEAAKVLGVSVDTIRKWQKQGIMPKPIPDDHLDPVINFRVQIEQAFRRKVDRERGVTHEND